MLQTVRRWLRPLLSSASSREKVRLVVEGTIVESGTHQPRTRLGPKDAPPESYFALELTSAALSDGTPRPVAQIVPAEFSGPVELLDQYAVGDAVRITTTTPTGRMIASMESAPRST